MNAPPKPWPPGSAEMTVVEPVSGDEVGPTFSVRGTCDGANSGVVITVTLTVTSSDTIYTFESEAEINPDPGPGETPTWEAVFDEIPPSDGGTSPQVSVTCTGGGSASSQGFTVVSTHTTQTDIEAPLDDEVFGSLAPPPESPADHKSPSPATPVARGKRGSNHHVAPFVTLGGFPVQASNPPPAATPHDWSFNLQDLMPNPAAAGRYVLHITTTSGNKTYNQVAGTFVYKPSQASS